MSWFVLVTGSAVCFWFNKMNMLNKSNFVQEVYSVFFKDPYIKGHVWCASTVMCEFLSLRPNKAVHSCLQSDIHPLYMCTSPANQWQWICSNTLFCVWTLWLCWLTVLMEGSRTTSLDQSTDGDVTKEAVCMQIVSLGRVLPWVCAKTKCLKC